MPCGGIYPIKVPAKYTCIYCEKGDTDHWAEEWDGPLHGNCVVPFLGTEEGKVIVDHKHLIKVHDKVLQEEGGIMDPDVALSKIREAICDAKYRQDAVDGESPSDRKWRSAHIEMDPLLEIIDNFEALDQWLIKGGFLPKAWAKKNV